MRPLNIFLSLVVVVPDGRLLLQRSTSDRSTFDFSRRWKGTLLHKVGVSHISETDILNNFCQATLGFNFKEERAATLMWQHDLNITDDARIRMFALKLNGHVEIKARHVEVLPVSFQRAFTMANKNPLDFISKSHSVINKMEYLYGGTGIC